VFVIFWIGQMRSSNWQCTTPWDEGTFKLAGKRRRKNLRLSSSAPSEKRKKNEVTTEIGKSKARTM
jgi:hypothetical protein